MSSNSKLTLVPYNVNMVPPNASQAAANVLQQLKSSETTADFHIKALGQTFPVHRCLIVLRSEYFARMLRPDSAFKEARENFVQFDDLHPGNVRRFVDYMYTWQYYAKPNIYFPQSDHDGLDALSHADMYAIGERLMIHGLKEFAKAGFERALVSAMSTKGQQPEYVAAIVPRVFGESSDIRDEDTGLKDLLINYILAQKIPDFLDNEKLTQTLETHVEFNMFLTKALWKEKMQRSNVFGSSAGFESDSTIIPFTGLRAVRQRDKSNTTSSRTASNNASMFTPTTNDQGTFRRGCG
ncbi:MAG: hypothetical protein M1831_000786 [Alyxoria varia]|nr:MAG: hypothetical protein M1831_000786 [Alyxoria varia]